MDISVIIPVRNAERHIGRAIGSVLTQTRPAGQIIVVDDGSTDGTAEAVRAFGESVCLIQQPTAGVSVARNTGIAAATGDWIAFLDADDEWMPDKLRLQADCHARFPQIRWSFTRLEWAHPTWSKRQPAHPDAAGDCRVFEDYLEAYCAGYFISTIAVMVHRSVFDTVGGFEPGMLRAQDNDLWFRIAYHYPPVGYVSQSLAVYHLDTPGSSTKINDQVDYMIALVDRHRELSSRYNRSEAFAPCIAHMLQVWIRQLERQRRYDDMRILLSRFADDLTRRFCREMRFRLLLPPLTSPVATLAMTAKHWFQSQRHRCPTL